MRNNIYCYVWVAAKFSRIMLLVLERLEFLILINVTRYKCVKL